MADSGQRIADSNSSARYDDGSITETGRDVVLFATMFQLPGSESALGIVP